MVWFKRLARWRHFTLALLIAIPLMIFVSIKPSHHRDWSKDQAMLPQAVLEGNQVHIRNIRNIIYRSTTDYDVSYYDKTFNLDAIESAWYVCEPFSTWRGLAHTFVSFRFDDGNYVAISVEIRKEKGESFSPVKGLLKQFEIMYVVGDERDLIKLRSNFRKDDVFLYRLRLDRQTVRRLFIEMLDKANTIYDRPEFYHTLTNTCLTTVVRHLNRIHPGKIPFSFSIIFPGFSDDYFYHLGLLDTELPFTEYRAAHRINARAEASGDAPDFSDRIRQFQAPDGSEPDRGSDGGPSK